MGKIDATFIRNSDGTTNGTELTLGVPVSAKGIGNGAGAGAYISVGVTEGSWLRVRNIFGPGDGLLVFIGAVEGFVLSLGFVLSVGVNDGNKDIAGPTLRVGDNDGMGRHNRWRLCCWRRRNSRNRRNRNSC